jgi:hypothetical protein
MTAIAVRRSPAFAPDRDLPGSADLLASAGAERVARFLHERGLEPHRVEAAQAHYRPGRWLTVCFRTAAIERTTGRPLAPIVTVDCRAGEPVAVWAFPDDPSLPGLAAASDAATLTRKLRPRPAAVEVEALCYRPRRRAVLRYRLGESGRMLFGKVVTPKRARRLLSLPEALRVGPLRLALPIGKLAAGAVVLPNVPGTSLRDLLLGGAPLPSPEKLARLPLALHRQCLPAPGADSPGAVRRRVDAATALGAAQVVARLLPEAACTAGRVAEAVIALAEEAEPTEEWIVHGDLYENQIVVDGDHLGLLDLDDLGPGDPLLDAANFCAHLLILGTSGGPAAARVLGYREALRSAFCRRLETDPAALAWREAYCILRLTSGPFRVLHPDWPRRMADRLTQAGRVLRR